MRFFSARKKASGAARQGRQLANGQARQEDNDEESVGAEGWLSTHGVQKSYRGQMVVKGVSLAASRGEAVGLLGPNGAGKTTLFYMIMGLVAADAGQIMLDGRDVTKLPMYRRARLGIGYLPQEQSIFRGLTTVQYIMAVLELVVRSR
jgi:lipopolysaccharide export system ATP-binding protein